MITRHPYGLRHFFTAALYCLITALTAAPTFATSPDEAHAFVDGIASKALAVIADKALSKEQKQSKLEKILGGGVDIPWVGRFTLGHTWREATEDQRKRYLKEYESFWVKHYASRFAEYSGGDYKITGIEEDDGQYTVKMTMTSTEDHKDVQVEYRLHLDDAKQLKIFDVVVENVSMITTQRAEFASVVSNKGLDYLIDQLAHRSLEVNNPS